MVTTDDVLSNMAGAKYFTKLDASNAYWQIVVDEESSKILTFNSPFGRYSFNRMPYGIHSASEICQRLISQIIENIEGCMNVQDDIIIWANSEEELSARTTEVLNAVEKSGFKLNESKCEFNKQTLTFLGHHISDQGVKPDPLKIAAVTEMPYPSNVKELQRFLGMINYLGKFIKNLSDITKPLRSLLEKENVWSFELHHKQAIDELKKMVTSSPTLSYYDGTKPTRVTTDFSGTGLGAMLEQYMDSEWKPICYASRSLSPAEQHYCPLEGETLSLVFGCERFYQYLYNTHFTLVNDHMPLRSIFKKPLYKVPPRLQRMMMRLLKYDFDLEYISGKNNNVSDTFSRSPNVMSEPEISDHEMQQHVIATIQSQPISAERLDEIVNETKLDPILQKVIKQIKLNWPDNDPSLQHFRQVRFDLTYSNGLVLKEHRIVIPKLLQPKILAKLHVGHQGIVKTKLRARETVYWPGINKQIEQLITQCETCQKYQNNQSEEPMLKHSTPDTPWTKVATDLFHITSCNKHYLIIIDYTSKFFEVVEIPDCQTSTVIEHMKQIFSRMGIPQEVISDNGPEYSSYEFKNFSKIWNFKHTTTSPTYPQSNGCVERMIQTVKRTIKKCCECDEDLHLGLLALRTTPLTANSSDPASILYNRQMRNNLPSMPRRKDIILPTRDFSMYQNKRELKPLEEGDKVRIHDRLGWTKKATVERKCEEPRSYIVRTEEGTNLRRNRRHLLRRPDLIIPSGNDKLSPDEHEQTQYEHSNELPNDNTNIGITHTRSGRVTRPPPYLQEYEE